MLICYPRLNTTRVESILDALFNDKDASTARCYKQLKSSRRIQNEFHVTLMHRASAAQNQAYWDNLIKLHETIQSANTTGSWEPELGKCGVHMERVLWDDRIMCFVVRLNGIVNDVVFESVNPVAHITVGTASQDIKPKESNDLLQRWLNEGSGGDSGIGELSVKGNIVLEGSVRGVLGRM
jgi:tRNA ligase